MDNRIIRKVFISLIIFIILFNHLQAFNDLANIVYAANIEVEEIKDEKDEVKNNEHDSEIEVEEYTTDEENGENKISADDSGESGEEIEIEELGEETNPIEKAVINASASIVRKVKTEKGIYVRDNISIEIEKNKTNIENVFVNFTKFLIDEVEPNRIYLNNKINLSVDNSIKVQELLVSETDKTLKYNYIIDMEYEKLEDVTEQNIIGNIKLENIDEVYNKDIDIIVEDKTEIVHVNNIYDYKPENESIYKGYIRANLVSNENFETNYSTINTIQVNNVHVLNEISIKENIDRIKTSSGEIELKEKVKYKQTRISKSQFDKIVGIFGFVEIYSDEKLIGTIDSNSQIDGNDYVYNYSKNVDHIEIVISNPTKGGELVIKNNKAIIGNHSFSDNEISSFKSIINKSIESCVIFLGTDNLEVTRNEKEGYINLEETISKVDLKMSKSVFSSEMNNDISFKILIDNSAEKYELFKNPTFDISLPNMVEEISIEDVYLVYNNGLTLNSWEILKSESGRKTIHLKLDGAQQNYTPGVGLNVTEIIVNAKLKVNELTPNGNTSIELRYTNEASGRNKFLLENKDCELYTAQYKSRNGILSYVSINNNNNNDDVIVATNSNHIIAQVDSVNESHNVDIKGNLVNNFSEEIKNVSIVGTIPAKGTINTEEVFYNNTFNTKLVKEISTSGLISTIYYSDKANCPIQDDSWTQNPSNINDMKSFKIVLNDDNMAHGEAIGFNIRINVPENLGVNQTGYMQFTVGYNFKNEECKEDFIINFKTESGLISEKECQTKEEIDSQEENESKLFIGSRATICGTNVVEGQDINEGQIIRYSILIENKSDSIINNIKVIESANNGSLYYLVERNESEDGKISKVYDWYEDIDGSHNQNTITIDKLLPGEKKTISYEVFARRNQGDEVYGLINVEADGVENYQLKTISGKIVDSEYELELFSSQNDVNNNSLKSSSNQDISLRIRNNSINVKQNINIKVILPKLVTLDADKASKFSDYIVDYVESEENNVLLMVVNNIESKADLYYSIPLKIGDIPIDNTSDSINIVARIDENERTYISNDYYRVVEQSKTKFESSIISNLNYNSIVSNGDYVEFTVKVRNTGNTTSPVELNANIPNGLRLKSIEIIDVDGKNREVFDDINKIKSYLEKFVLSPGKTISIKITGTVDQSLLFVEQGKIEYKVQSNQIDLAPYVLLLKEEEIPSMEWYFGTIYNNEYAEEEEDDYKFDEINEGIGATSVDLLYIGSEDEDDYESTDNNQEENDNTVVEEDYIDYEENDEHDEYEEETLDDNVNISSFGEFVNQYMNESKEDTSEGQTKSISGIVWLDSNRDGINDNEEYIKDINVYLYKDDIKDSNLVGNTKTEDNGVYQFENTEDGKYYVVFEYDNGLYSATKYNKASSVSEIVLKINNNEKVYAISDIITAEESSKVDIGLVSKNKMDFEINTCVDSITMIKDGDVETVEFDNKTQLPKIEILRKDIEDTLVRIKYTISVTNKGNIDGYALQLKDIIPDGFIFEEGQNLNWKIGTDKSIYYSGLSKSKINAGETKTISLVLTKEKDNPSLGTFTNNVELVDTSNDYLVEETITNNNQDKQSVMFSIKTGALTYVLLVISIAIFVAIIVIIFVNKIIKKQSVKKQVIKILVIVFIITIILLLLTNTFALSTRKVESLNKVEELFGKDEDSTLGNYDAFKEASDILEEYNKTGHIYSINDVDGTKIQYSSIQEEIKESDNGNSYGINSIYSVNSNDYIGNSTDNSKTTDLEVAFLGYLLESDYESERINQEDLKYNLARALYYEHTDNKAINSDTDIYSQLTTKFVQYKSESDNNSIEKIYSNDVCVYKLSSDYVGPFYFTAPQSSSGKYVVKSGDSTYTVGDIINNNNYIEYYSIDKKEWKGLEAEIVYNNKVIGKSDGDGKIQTSDDLSNKTILIKFLDEEAKNDVSKIRIRNTHNEYEATGIDLVWIRNNQRQTNPDITVLRGKQNEISSEQVWNYSAYNISIDNYAYRVYKSENDNITGTIVDTVGSRSNSSEKEKYDYPLGVDLKDIIITCVEFTNNGKQVDGFRFNDRADYQLTYVGYTDNIPEEGAPEIHNEASLGNWKVSNKDERTITYSGSIAEGESVKLYLAYRLDYTKNTNEIVGEIVELEKVYSNSKNIMDLLDESSTTSNSEAFGIRKSYVEISSSLYSHNGNTRDFTEFNPGDEVVIKTRVSNKSENENTVYGTVYNVRFSNSVSLSDDKKFEDYLEFNGYSLNPNDFSIKGSEYIERLDNDNDNVYDYQLNLGILVGDNVDLYTSYTLKDVDKENGLTISQDYKIESIENRNGELEVANVDLGPVIKGNTDDITVDDYSLTIKKEVVSIKKANGGSTGSKTIAETGDKIEYKITVQGNGTAPLVSKTQYIVICLDYSNSMIFYRNFEKGNGVTDSGEDENNHGGVCFNANHWENHTIGTQSEVSSKHKNGRKRGKQFGCKDRLDITVEALDAFCDEIFKNTNNRIALTMFAGAHRIGDESAWDDDFYDAHYREMDRFVDKDNKYQIIDVLNSLNTYNSSKKVKPNVGRATHFNEGLTKAANIINRTTIPSDAEVSVLFLSDGEPQINGVSDSSSLYEIASGKTEAAALKQNGVKIVCIGLGTDTNRSKLEDISSPGETIIISDESTLKARFEKIAQDEFGASTVNADDYVKVKTIKLVDTLGDGLSYNANSIGNSNYWKWNDRNHNLHKFKWFS